MATTHLQWIDNLKGIAILLVIAHHFGLAKQEYFQWFHTGQGVSIFLFCSAYVLADKQDFLSTFRMKRMLQRILTPMLLCTLFLILTSCFFLPIGQVLETCLHGAGLGPGSYFPWLYILFWVCLPFFKKLYSIWDNAILSFFAFSIVCAALECIFSLVSTHIDYEVASNIWRVLPLRYLMIIYAVLSFHHFEKHKLLSLSLFFVCGGLAWFDIYPPHSHSYINSWGWHGYHWFTVLYVVPLVLVLRKVRHRFLEYLGKYSYEIFIVQMMVFYTVNTFGIARYPTYSSIFRIIQLLLLITLSYITIKIKQRRQLL